MVKKSQKLDPKKIEKIIKYELTAAYRRISSQISEEPSDDPEIVIFDSSAIPVGLFMRDSVLETMRQEIIKDVKAGLPVPPGAKLVGVEEEEASGETQEVHDNKDDSSDGRNGSDAPGDSNNNGAKTGGGRSSDSRGPGKSDSGTPAPGAK